MGLWAIVPRGTVLNMEYVVLAWDVFWLALAIGLGVYLVAVVAWMGLVSLFGQPGKRR